MSRGFRRSCNIKRPSRGCRFLGIWLCAAQLSRRLHRCCRLSPMDRLVEQMNNNFIGVITGSSTCTIVQINLWRFKKSAKLKTTKYKKKLYFNTNFVKLICTVINVTVCIFFILRPYCTCFWKKSRQYEIKMENQHAPIGSTVPPAQQSNRKGLNVC